MTGDLLLPVSLLPVSFLVAAVVMLGGAPLLRQAVLMVRPDAAHEDGLVGVGGVVLVLALVLDSFYVSALPRSADVLLQAMVLLLAFEAVLWGAFKRPLRWRIRNLAGPLVLAALVLGVIEVDPSIVYGGTGMIVTIGFVAAMTLLPLALTRLAERFPTHSAMSLGYPLLPAAVAMMTLSLHASFSEAPAVHALRDVLYVFVPCLGAIAACGFYTMRMPWRDSARYCLGSNGQMVVGLAFAWGALQIAPAGERPGASMVAMLWMIAPVFFEAAREVIRTQFLPALEADEVHPRVRGWMAQPSSSWVVYTTAAVMPLLGLLSYWTTSVPVYLSGVILPLVFLVYLVAPGWLAPSAQPVDLAKPRAPRESS